MSDPRRGLPSASSFETDVLCNGRQNLIRAMPPQPIEEEKSDDVAARGTRIHEARATGSTLNLRDDSELEAYKKGCKLEWSVINQWKEDNRIESHDEGVSEERYWFHHPFDLSPLLSGQLDVYYLAKTNALICDWKTSTAMYVKPANASWQTRIYALLLWQEFPQLRKIRVAFIKPEAFGQQVDYADFTLFDLQNIEREVLRVLWLAQQPDAPLNAGAHCRYCPARGVCEEAARYAMLPAVIRRPSLKETLELISLMPTEAALQIWQRKGEITKILEAITARLASQPPEELERLGLKLTEGKKADLVRDVHAAFTAMKEAGFDEAQIFTALDFNKERLLKVIQNQLGCRERSAEVYYENQFDEFIERKRQKPSLVEK